MSFSSEIKEELSGHYVNARHCNYAELAAIMDVCGQVEFDSAGKMKGIEIRTENDGLIKKCFTILTKAFNIKNVVISQKLNSQYIRLENPEEIELLRNALKCEETADNKHISFLSGKILVHNTCCKRAYIRGAFLAAGSVSDPEKAYHFEVVYSELEKAERLRDMIHYFEADAKIIERKKHYVVYLKEGSQIVDILNVMEAHVSLMRFENIRIVKEMRNSINRQVNCEAANINKTVQAATKQLEDIRYIRDTIGFDGLSEGLEEIAKLRIDYPEASLKELGEMMSEPLGKSGVNHRLKRLSSIADEIRVSKEV